YNISKSVATSILKNILSLSNLKESELVKKTNLTNSDAKYSEIDSFIIEKIEMLRRKNFTVNQNTIHDLALDYYKAMNDNVSKVTKYFVKNFVKRRSINYVTLHGEAASADTTLIDIFKDDLKRKLEVYNKKDVFNIDETSLYIKTCSNKSYVLDKKTDNKNVKQNKTRITLLLGTNPFGEKMKPLLIGKSKNPRAFKNLN
ncbi:Tigger transposable element-derived protein 1, partial [Dictyocoela muelleri]